MSYQNQFKNNFFNISDKMLRINSPERTRFFNHKLNETGVKFRNVLFSIMAINPAKTEITINKLTRKSKNCDYPFKDKEAIKDLINTFDDEYFTLIDNRKCGSCGGCEAGEPCDFAEETITVIPTPHYFNDFKNAKLRVYLTEVNTRSMQIFHQELINLFVPIIKEKTDSEGNVSLVETKKNYLYFNLSVKQQGLKENTIIESYSDKKRCFKATIERQLKSCFTIDSDSVKWTKKGFIYQLTEATKQFRMKLIEAQKVAITDYKGLIAMIRSAANSSKLEEKRNKVLSTISNIRSTFKKGAKKVVEAVSPTTAAAFYYYDEIEFDDEPEQVTVSVVEEVEPIEMPDFDAIWKEAIS
jgi:hypothetical protein